MTPVVDLHTRVGEIFAARERAGRALADDAEAVARACHDMAVRFHRGGKLIVFGNGGASTDSSHIVVEFMHPVIVGKRALPAMALSNDPATITGVANRDGFAETFAHQLRHFADPHDIALGVSADGNCVNVVRALRTARERGLLTVALVGGTGGHIADGQLTGQFDDAAPDSGAVADHILVARSHDPAVVKEIHVTTYHILWELVHVFFEHPGVLAPAVVK
jgi:D-sedoheptulose 7-phosphate isomerase